jgi:hypothetical protein
MSLVSIPRQQSVDQNGNPRVGAKWHFYEAGTSTPITLYTTQAYDVEQDNPVTSLGNGYFPAVYVNEAENPTHKQVMLDADGLTVFSEDDLSSSALLYPITAAEQATGVAIAAQYATYNTSTRYGLIPNDAASATANSTILRALFDPTVDGIRGDFAFIPVIGGDTFYFNQCIEIAPNIALNLNSCRLLFNMTANAADNTYGCLNYYRDVTIENGTIEANVTGTGVSNAYMLIRMGSRDSYPVSGFPDGIYDKDDLADANLSQQGNCVLRNLTFKTNNPSANALFMVLELGGLYNCIHENLTFIGSGASGPESGIYYEFGSGSKNGQAAPAHWSSSHAVNMVYRNIRGRNLKTSGTSDGYVVALVECASFLAENIHGETVAGVFESRIGEAHFFRVWSRQQTAAPRIGILRNITGVDCASTAITLNGSQGTATGYLSDANMTAAGLTPLTAAQKVDLQQYILDGFDLDIADTGIAISAPASVLRGSIRGGTNAINVSGECVDATFDGVQIFGASMFGLRATDTSTIFARKRRLRFLNGKIAGCSANAIDLNYVETAYIGFNQLGYNTAFDSANESTQDIGVNVAGDAAGVVCDSNYVTTSGAAVAYVNAGTSDRGCNIVNPRGTTTFSANVWQIDGVARATDSALVDDGHAINTTNKYEGKKVWDTSNSTMRIAMGSAANSVWRAVDNSGDITPA